MLQLVGCRCVRCQQIISSIVEGEFCRDCGNPVHKHCAALSASSTGKCTTCGGEVSNPMAVEGRKALTEEAQRPLQGNYPVSRYCPACESTEFTTVRPTRWIAFKYDRVCNRCGAAYSPPTPLWASIAFIVAGIMLTGYAPLALLLGSPCDGLLIVPGMMAIGQGLRGIIRMGKA
jgi:hypothetical protein